jgi:hypothetical protein
MPVSTRSAESDLYGDPDHWHHVIESLFVPAVQAAGFRAIRPVASGSHLIHGSIIRHLSDADLVLCDLSSHNPNVFFELGVRTSLNLPVALVRDEHTDLPFDTSGINTHSYDSRLRGWDIEEQRSALTEHLGESTRSCGGENPLWRQFGLTIRAHEPDTQASPLEAKIDLLTGHIAVLQARLNAERAYDKQPRDDEQTRYSPAPQAHVSGLQTFSAWPVTRFLAALRRFTLESPHLVFEAEPLNSSEVRVNVGPSWTLSDVDRATELADRYGVSVRVQAVSMHETSVEELASTSPSERAAARRAIENAHKRRGSGPDS